MEASGLVEGDGFGVAFGDGEGEGGVAAFAEFGGGGFEQEGSEAEAAVLFGDADLGDVGGVVADAGTEHEGGEFFGAVLDDDLGGGGVEGAAAGKADDVVQEAERAGDGAVLVVDVAVEVAFVDAAMRRPAAVKSSSRQVRSSIPGGSGLGGRGASRSVLKEVGERGGEVALHEEAGKDLESGAGEDRGVRAREGGGGAATRCVRCRGS